jgi:hypothetical protein
MSEQEDQAAPWATQVPPARLDHRLVAAPPAGRPAAETPLGPFAFFAFICGSTSLRDDLDRHHRIARVERPPFVETGLHDLLPRALGCPAGERGSVNTMTRGTCDGTAYCGFPGEQSATSDTSRRNR